MKHLESVYCGKRLRALIAFLHLGLLGFVVVFVVSGAVGILSSCGPGGGLAVDSGTGSAVTNPGTNPNPGTFTFPILFNLEQGNESLCVGEIITLIGVNFSQNLNNNRVVFRSGRAIVEGTPVSITFPVDGNPANGLDSRLQVLVPTGVVSGSVELEVSGIFAGGFGFVACPMIFGFTIGLAGQEPPDDIISFPAIQHNGILGFDPALGPETILLHGINLEDVTEIQVRDTQGNRATIPSVGFQRRTLIPDNGMDTLLFSLEGIRLAIQGIRDNILVKVASEISVSNEIAVPQQPMEELQGADPLSPMGPVINTVFVPFGVRTGKIPILYSFYDKPLTMTYRMIFEWTADGGNTWFCAMTGFAGDPEMDDCSVTIPVQGDPLNDGVLNVLPGHIDFPSPPAGIFRGLGAIKTFIWDPDLDTNFQDLIDTSDQAGLASQRSYTLQFRISAEPLDDEGDTRFNPGILVQTPPISYFDLDDRATGTDVSDLRESEFVEEFNNDSRKEPTCRESQDPIEDECTTAFWDNTGTLEGAISIRPDAQFGDGSHPLVLDLKEIQPVLSEIYFINTTLMQIDRIVEINAEEVVAFPVFPDPVNGIVNPGQARGEFHLESLIIDPGVLVNCEGDRPLVFRLSGTEDVSQPVFEHFGTIDANGKNGEGVVGGRSILGSGEGGNGADLATIPDFSWELIPSTGGGLNGGGAGESPMGLSLNLDLDMRVQGAPGGGGGSRIRGGDGESATPVPTIFKSAVPGVGGPKRGNEKLLLPVPGSGGGGGGLGLSRLRGQMDIFDNYQEDFLLHPLMRQKILNPHLDLFPDGHLLHRRRPCQCSRYQHRYHRPHKLYPLLFYPP